MYNSKIKRKKNETRIEYSEWLQKWKRENEIQSDIAKMTNQLSEIENTKNELIEWETDLIRVYERYKSTLNEKMSN